MSKHSSPQRTPIKPQAIIMDSLDLDEDGSSFKPDKVEDSTVKLDDLISKINQLPQTTQLSEV